MTYNSKIHQEVFDKAMVKKNENNYKLIAVIYLLTADNTLWNLAKDAVKKNTVDFNAIKLKAIHPKGDISCIVQQKISIQEQDI